MTPVLLTGLAAATDGAPIQRPPPLAPVSDCELWRGDALEANAGSARLLVRLCPAGEGVKGTLQWSSIIGGWAELSLTGQWSGEHLTLTEQELLEDHPAPGWQFCHDTIYRLSLDGPDRLVGSFSSSDCNDSGNITLIREGLDRMPSAPLPPPEPDTVSEESPPRGAPDWLCMACSALVLLGGRALRRR